MPTGWFVVKPPSAGVLRNNRKPVSLGFAGQQLTDGSVAPVNLKKISTSMVGQVPLTGPMNIALKKLVMSMSGEEKTFGGITFGLKRLSPTFDQELVSGVLSAKLRPPRFDFLGVPVNDGAMNVQVQPVRTTLVGTQEFTGALATQLKRAEFALVAAELKVRTQRNFSQSINRSSTR